MTRLVLRVCLGVVLSLAIFVVCAELLLWRLEEPRAGDPGEDVIVEILDGTAVIATRRLERARSPREREIVLTRLEDTFGFGFWLDDRTALAELFPEEIGGLTDPGPPFLLPPEESDELILVVPEAPSGDDPDVLLIGPIPDPLLASEEAEEDTLWLDLAVFLLITFVTAWLILRPTARKVRRLEEVTDRFGRGEVDARADLQGSGLIAELGERFDQMADRIGTLVENQRYLLHSISHEIRTPLARTQFRLEELQTAETDEKRAKHLAGLETDLAALEALIEELLSFVRLTEGEMSLDKTPFDAVAAVERLLAESAADEQPQVSARLVADDNDETPILANEALFRRAVSNLIANARRAASESVEVRVRVTQEGHCRVEVADDGPGVPEADREAIFQPFARTDDSRTRSAGGVGLGLALVARIAELHGGKASVERDDVLGGARFVITWLQDASGTL